MADKTHELLRSGPLDDETLLSLLSATRREAARVAGPHLSSEQIVDRVAGSLSKDEAARADVHLAFCEECHALAYWLEHDNFGSAGYAEGLAYLPDSAAEETASEGRVIRFPLRELRRLGASSGDVPMRVAAADPAAAGSYSETSVHGARTITVSIDAKDEVIVSVAEHEQPVSGAQVAVGFAGNQLAKVIPTKDGTTDDDGEVSLGPLTGFRSTSTWRALSGDSRVSPSVGEVNVPLSIDDFTKQLQVPLQVGNLLIPFRETVGRLLATKPQQKRQLYGALCDALQRRGTSALYVTAVKQVIDSYRDNDKFDGERQALARLLAGCPQAAHAPGEVTVLLGCTQPFLGQPFGVAQTLRVRSRPWGGTIELEREGSSGENEDTLYQGFRKGCEAGLEHLLSRGLDLLSGSILINNYTAQGTLPALHIPGSGHSLGLGAAIATLSGALGVPIPERTAFTGQVEIDGTIRSVGQIDVKVSAAVDVGITHVFLPNGHGATGDNAVTLHPCGALREAVDGVFTKGQIEAGIQKLRTVAGNITAHRRWREVYTTSSGRMLLSVVGKSDPIGTLKNRHGKPITEQDGPILSAFRALRPRHVVLLYTALKGDNNLLHNATETRRFLQKEDKYCTVQLVELHGVSDPTDVGNLWNVFSQKIGEIVDSAQEDSVICTNVSSGSPQMQIVWHLLAERRILPGELLQVRESRFVEEGTTRVRPVVLPAVTTSGTAASPTPPFHPPVGS